MSRPNILQKYAWSAPDARGYLFDRRERPETANRIGESGGAAEAHPRLDAAAHRAASVGIR